MYFLENCKKAAQRTVNKGEVRVPVGGRGYLWGHKITMRVTLVDPLLLKHYHLQEEHKDPNQVQAEHKASVQTQPYPCPTTGTLTGCQRSAPK